MRRGRIHGGRRVLRCLRFCELLRHSRGRYVRGRLKYSVGNTFAGFGLPPSRRRLSCPAVIEHTKHLEPLAILRNERIALKASQEQCAVIPLMPAGQTSPFSAMALP